MIYASRRMRYCAKRVLRTEKAVVEAHSADRVSASRSLTGRPCCFDVLWTRKSVDRADTTECKGRPENETTDEDEKGEAKPVRKLDGLEECIEVLGGRVTDLEFMAHRIEAGETPRGMAPLKRLTQFHY